MIENEEVQQPEVVIQGPGLILKQARERANLSTQDIADRMKLKRALIEDIEKDNFDINISLTFVRGYLKLYAKHVHVPEIEILTAFESLSTQKKEPIKLQSFSRRVATQANDDKLMLVTYLIVAAVVALVVIWWLQQSPTETTASNVSVIPDKLTQNAIKKRVSTIADDLTSGAEILISPLTNDDTLSKSSADTTSEVLLVPVLDKQVIDIKLSSTAAVATTSNLNTQADVTQTTQTATVSPVELIFEFSGDCWMNLSDATGENIAYGVKVNGRVMPVMGIPPFVVTLGAPEVVKIRYAGEPIDMTFLPSGRIAKFDLPLSE
jgi:cytoskeleton protein RodZ